MYFYTPRKQEWKMANTLHCVQPELLGSSWNLPFPLRSTRQPNFSILYSFLDFAWSLSHGFAKYISRLDNHDDAHGY